MHAAEMVMKHLQLRLDLVRGCTSLLVYDNIAALVAIAEENDLYSQIITVHVRFWDENQDDEDLPVAPRKWSWKSQECTNHITILSTKSVAD